MCMKTHRKGFFRNTCVSPAGAAHGPDGDEALSALRDEQQPVLPAAGGAVLRPALRLALRPQIPDGDAQQRADGDGRDAVPSATGRRRSVHHVSKNFRRPLLRWYLMSFVPSVNSCCRLCILSAAASSPWTTELLMLSLCRGGCGPGRAGQGQAKFCCRLGWGYFQTAVLGSLMTDAASDASQTKGLNQLSAAFGWNQTAGNLNQNKN